MWIQEYFEAPFGIVHLVMESLIIFKFHTNFEQILAKIGFRFEHDKAPSPYVPRKRRVTKSLNEKRVVLISRQETL